MSVAQTNPIGKDGRDNPIINRQVRAFFPKSSKCPKRPKQKKTGAMEADTQKVPFLFLKKTCVEKKIRSSFSDTFLPASLEGRGRYFFASEIPPPTFSTRSCRNVCSLARNRFIQLPN